MSTTNRKQVCHLVHDQENGNNIYLGKEAREALAGAFLKKIHIFFGPFKRARAVDKNRNLYDLKP